MKLGEAQNSHGLPETGDVREPLRVFACLRSSQVTPVASLKEHSQIPG